MEMIQKDRVNQKMESGRRRMHQGRRQGGFTLIELMMVVAIMGLLAALAIPRFTSFQLNSKRSEAFSMVALLAKLQTEHFGVNGFYLDTAVAYPGAVPGTQKRPWDAASEAAFGALGFDAQGAVFFSYEVTTLGCGAADCFTVVAYGDTDANGLVSAIQYTHPGSDGSEAQSALMGIIPDPRPIDDTGVVRYNMVLRNASAGRY